MPADANGGYQTELLDRTSAGVEVEAGGGEALGAACLPVPEPTNAEDSELCLQLLVPEESFALTRKTL